MDLFASLPPIGSHVRFILGPNIDDFINRLAKQLQVSCYDQIRMTEMFVPQYDSRVQLGTSPFCVKMIDSLHLYKLSCNEIFNIVRMIGSSYNGMYGQVTPIATVDSNGVVSLKIDCLKMNEIRGYFRSIINDTMQTDPLNITIGVYTGPNILAFTQWLENELLKNSVYFPSFYCDVIELSEHFNGIIAHYPIRLQTLNNGTIPQVNSPSTASTTPAVHQNEHFSRDFITDMNNIYNADSKYSQVDSHRGIGDETNEYSHFSSIFDTFASINQQDHVGEYGDLLSTKSIGNIPVENGDFSRRSAPSPVVPSTKLITTEVSPKSRAVDAQLGKSTSPKTVLMPRRPPITPLKPKGDVREGDWICTACNGHNFSNKLACFTCHKARVGGEATIGGAKEGVALVASDDENNVKQAVTTPTSGSSGVIMAGDWECPKCKENVFAKRNRCYKCSTCKPKSLYSSGSPDRSPISKQSPQSNRSHGSSLGHRL